MEASATANTWGGYQPRYVAYCIAQGYASPQIAMESDRQRWSGGVMCGFILWTSERWQEWRKENGRGRDAGLTKAQHDAFDDWLKSNAKPIGNRYQAMKAWRLP